MFNIFPKKLILLEAKNKLENLSHAERVVYWTIVLTPLWWVLGVQTLLYPGVALYLLAYDFHLDKLVKRSLPLCNWTWLLLSLAVLWTNIQGLSSISFNAMKSAATVVTLLKGYFLVFSCLTIPFWHRVRLTVVTRAVSWMTGGYLVSLGIQLLILFGTGPQKAIMPPLAKAIPGDKLSLMVKFAVFQPFFGLPLARTELYTADPPILGVCALLCFFMCFGETDKYLRKYALAGCTATLIIAQSRLAWICFPIALLAVICFRKASARQGFLWFSTLICFICALIGMEVTELLDKPMETFNGARADSSKDRALVVAATLKAWKESPWIGWGIVERTVTWGNGAFELPLGTFSTYAQILYLHGIFGFTFFAIAVSTTLWFFWQPALRGKRTAQRAFASFIAMLILCQATNLSWMIVYFWFYFLWLGTILAEAYPQYVSSWQELSRNHDIKSQ
ncbi:O-antigen ligase domain-containing protein [Scytonema sp. UIC 10036]|uniref:O-antigen ligase family protein n=1 Tax=Scytonema sp. UIC 10036 TaxID=2304196 RepID=UPI0012DAB334|nr:O-antigen ligase family protein [Scytonema sp. UIC 10036]MUG96110.1 O-antigen ligase domain-containing protein [Scytonema sp. UIC 10036]